MTMFIYGRFVILGISGMRISGINFPRMSVEVECVIVWAAMTIPTNRRANT